MQQYFTFQATSLVEAEEPSADDEPVVTPPPTEPPTTEPPPGSGEPPGGDPSVSLLDAARERYLNYALSVITARALPDVRDGLKPVQRRIVYAMWANLHLTHTARFRKSAAVVGEVMARFHPHGDQSIYDAMVRLAQPFALRHPLVDGHGNFGSLDGDSAAAMRYTESRLQAVAAELVKEIGSDTVPFRANYDGTTTEPVVLPSRIPNLLVNGVTGIAVGMATNIPPHNLREVVQAAVALIDNPAATVIDLMAHVEGPDFPIGGEILNSRRELEDIYTTGRGAVRLRATWRAEKANRRRWIVIDSIPYGQNKATVVQQIGDLIRDNKVPQLTDVRDESTDDIRIVCELKRGANDVVAMAFLFKNTGLRTNFNVNLTVLLPTSNPEVGAPRQVGLLEILRQFCDFRLQVVRRRFEYELAKLQQRIHILRGFAILFDALDEAIALIRASDGKADAARRLMARFPLDEIQTDAILELKLYRLAKLEIHAVMEELERLEAEAARIEAILASEEALWGVVRSELLEVAEAHGDDRRTRIGGAVEELEFDASRYIVSKNTWVIVTRDGWVKRQKGFTEISTIRVRDGDEVATVIRASTTSTVAIFSSFGKCYVLLVDDIQQTSGHGEPVQARFAFADGERIVSVVSMDPRNLPAYHLAVPVQEQVPGPEEEQEQGQEPEQPPPVEDDDIATLPPDAEVPATAVVMEDIGPVAVAISRLGKGLILPLSAHSEQSTRSGRKFMSVSPGKGDAVVAVEPLRQAGMRVALASERGRVLLFEAESLKLLRRSGKGVNAIRLSKTDGVLDFSLLDRPSEALEVQTSRGRSVRVWERKYARTKRGGKGFEVIKLGHLVRVDRPARLIDPFAGGEEPEDDELSAEEIDAELGVGEDAAEGDAPEEGSDGT